MTQKETNKKKNPNELKAPRASKKNPALYTVPF